ncbi:MAG: hypothetical protein JSW52_10900 [Candidatus Coatesbacteria bacterium]|nr:MAG: hypothetical protein JSW52_10900 [Candidatus Coatesbacteria bacterium]
MKQVKFNDAALFRLYDKGIAVRSKTLSFHSHKDEDSDELARWTVEAVGYPHVYSTQEIGIPDHEVRTEGTIKGYYGRGTRIWAVKDLDDTPPTHGWEATVHDSITGYRQWLGKLLKITDADEGWTVECERPFGYPISSGSAAYFYRPGVLPTDNLLVPKLCDVEIRYEQEEGPASPVPAPVEIYRRFWRRGKTSFYFADKTGEVAEGETARLDAGFYAFVSQHELQDIEIKIDDEVYVHHYNEPASPFNVILKNVAHPAYFLSAGLWVEQEPQDAKRFSAPGNPKAVIHGRPLYDTDGEPVEGAGGVFFGEGPNGAPWVGRNVVGFDPNPKVFVKGCALGRFDGARLDGKFNYRGEDDYLGLPPYELSGGMAAPPGELAGPRILTTRIWKRTRLQVVWAAPPGDDELPAGYDGGWAAVLMVPGDRTELLEEGDVIRLGAGPGDEPYPREYVVSESGAGVRYVDEDSPYALDDSWRGRTEVFTWLIILELDSSGDLTHDERVRLETLGKYISVARGWDVRHEVWKAGQG